MKMTLSSLKSRISLSAAASGLLFAALLSGCISHNQNDTRLEERPYTLKFRQMDRGAAEKRVFRVLYQVSRQHLGNWDRLTSLKDQSPRVFRDSDGTTVHYYGPGKGTTGAPAWHMMWFTNWGRPSIMFKQFISISKSTGRENGVSFYELRYKNMKFCAGTFSGPPSFKTTPRDYARDFAWLLRKGKADFECAHSNHRGRTTLRFYKHRDLRNFVRVMTAVFPQIELR